MCANDRKAQKHNVKTPDKPLISAICTPGRLHLNFCIPNLPQYHPQYNVREIKHIMENISYISVQCLHKKNTKVKWINMDALKSEAQAWRSAIISIIYLQPH